MAACKSRFACLGASSMLYPHARLCEIAAAPMHQGEWGDAIVLINAGMRWLASCQLTGDAAQEPNEDDADLADIWEGVDVPEPLADLGPEACNVGHKQCSSS